MGLWDDLRYAKRSLLRAPGYAATCIFLLAMGIASTTAIVSVGDSLLVRPLPVTDADRLIVPLSGRGERWLLPSAIDVAAWRDARSLQGIAAAIVEDVSIVGDGRPERVHAARIEAAYLPLLGVSPIAGRPFEAVEARAREKVALIGFGLWQRRFGADPGAVGGFIRIDNEAFQVIGVLPAGFDQPFAAELWRPLDVDATPEDERARRVLAPVARLAVGTSVDEAREELAAISRRLETERPDTHSGWEARAMTLRQNLMSDRTDAVPRSVAIMALGALFLTFIACANVVQLSLVRAAGRSVELATRLVVGGSRSSLARMLALEGAVVAGAGGLLSIPGSLALSKLLVELSPISTDAFSSRMLAVPFDARVLAVVASLTLLVSLVAAVYPALRASRIDFAAVVSESGRSTARRGMRRFFDAAVSMQIAATVALVATAGALAESYTLLRRLDVGFRAEGLAFYELPLSENAYAEHERRAAFAETLVDAVRRLDGVAGAGISTDVPLSSRTWVARYACEGREDVPGEDLIAADRLVGPGYLEVLGVRLRAGRTLTERDRASSELVAVVNESLASECWPGRSAREAVGQRVRRLTRGRSDWMTVVGVVADARELRQDFRREHAAWYLPYRQHDIFRELKLVVRGESDVSVSAAAVRSIVERIDPTQPVSAPSGLVAHLEDVMGPDSMAATVTIYFSLLSIALAGTGIHGSMARYVGQQRRAIGIRMAVGAGRAGILGLIAGRGFVLSTIGVVVGALGASLLQVFTESFVYGALMNDSTRLVLAAALTLALAVSSCAAPAHRATRIDPGRLLRE